MTYLGYLLCLLNLIVDSLLVCSIVLDCEFNLNEFYLETPVRLGLEKESLSKLCAFISARCPKGFSHPGLLSC